MTPEQLKSSILQYAIQGKLTDQRTSDDNVSELIKHLKECKAELVKNKIIKKEKQLPDFSDEEIPFDIPDSWEWCYCQDIFFAHSAMRIHQSDWKSEGIPFFRGRELVRLAKTGDPNAEVFITEEFYAELNEKGGVPKKDDILITAVGTLGKVYVVQGTKKFYYKDAYILCLDNYGVDPYYIKYLVESPYCQNYIYGDDAYGTTVAQLTLEKLKKMLIPVPPLEEQHRIVSKIEELLPYVDRYAEAYEKLEQFNAKFPEDMKKSILQYAIQGKLVEQRPEEGTAEELYQQIQDEKQKLIKDKRIKKEKPLAEIAEDEIPFDIPESWKWCRLSEVIDVRDGTHDSPKYVPEGIPLVTSKNLSNGTIDYGNIKYITQADADKINERSAVDDGDILFAMIGSIGNPVLVKKDREFCIKNMALFKRYTDTDIDMNYMYWFFYFVQYSLKAEASGGVQSFISLTRFREYPFPLPPYEEQKRIAKRIEEVLPLCGRLSERVTI